MKLSKDTVALFKNFAGINSNLLLKNGNKLATISAQKNVMADATVGETFPDFAIYDLNEFLGAMSLFDDPELDFQNKYVSIKQGSMNIKFYAADPSVLTAPQKSITFPEAEINFNLNTAMLNMIHKTAGVLRAADRRRDREARGLHRSGTHEHGAHGRRERRGGRCRARRRQDAEDGRKQLVHGVTSSA